MQTKLTLRLDSALIMRAKQHAEGRKQSLSKIVADYFRSFGKRTSPGQTELSPTVKALRGILKGVRVDEKRELHRYWEGRYR